jgi:hypothetical protein
MQGHIREMAALLQGMGRGGDTILAHINPREAMLLDAVTDGGSINPVTGMPEFMIGDDVGQEMDDFDDEGYGFADEHAMSMSPSVDMEAQLGGFSEGHFSPSPGTQGVRSPVPGTLSPQNEPSFFGALVTALPEVVLGLIPGLDVEFTGRDVFPPDLSRALSGMPTQQPPGVEFNPGSFIGGLASPAAAIIGGLISPTIDVSASGNVTTYGGVNSGLTLPDSIINESNLSSVSANGLALPGRENGLPPSELMDVRGDDYFSSLGSPVTKPEEIANQIVEQQEMARALTMPNPGFTRSGQGRIYL